MLGWFVIANWTQTIGIAAQTQFGNHGRVTIYSKISLNSTTRTNIGDISVLNFFECCVVELKSNINIVVIALYRPPKSTFQIPIDKLLHLLNFLCFDTIIGGEFNVNFLELSSSLRMLSYLIHCFNLHYSIDNA